MVDVHGYVVVAAPAPAAAPLARASLWFFIRTFLRTWLLVALGGAGCGAFCANVSSLAFFLITMPCGFALGAAYGLPVVLALSIGLTFARPGADPRRFVRTLQGLGMGIALVINGTTNVLILFTVASDSAAESTTSALLGVLAVPLTVAGITASCFVGCVCGATLAQRQLAAMGHPEAAARSVARRRRPWR